jgi:hypothetical protein
MAVAAALGLAAWSASCAKSTEPKKAAQPEATREALDGPEYRLVLLSDDSTATAPNWKHGFSVNSDGTYQVGPAPDGQIITGILNPQEFAELDQGVAQLRGASTTAALATESLAGESCAPAALSSEDSSEGLTLAQGKLTLTLRSGQKASFRRTDSGFCSPRSSEPGSVDQDYRLGAQVLYLSVQKLASKYTPGGFPDSCSTAIAAFQESAREAESCVTDSDCSYLDELLEPIAPDEVRFVMTDDCTALPAPVTSNAGRLSDMINTLFILKSGVQEACAERFFREDCTIGGFQADLAPPVCLQGKCRVNPTLYR